MPLARKDINLWPTKPEIAVSQALHFFFTPHTCCFFCFFRIIPDDENEKKKHN
jgi:hypothetical protein